MTMKYADAREYRPIAESVIQQAGPPQARTRFRPWLRRIRRGRLLNPRRWSEQYRKGSVITSVDHDCWPAKAMLKSTITNCTGECITSRIDGITPALMPSAIFREAFTEGPAGSAGSKTIRPAGSRFPPLRTESTQTPQPVWCRSGCTSYKILRQPENVEVPGGITQKLGDHQAGDLRIAQKIDPMDRLRAGDFGARTSASSSRSSRPVCDALRAG